MSQSAFHCPQAIRADDREMILKGKESMKGIHYIKQPTEYLCGQACVAMIANVSVDEVIRVMDNDKASGKKDIERALAYYGIAQAKTMTKADNSTPLPPVCILKVLLPRYSHWILYYHGKYYDPEFGLTDELYCKARIQSYLELYESGNGSEGAAEV